MEDAWMTEIEFLLRELVIEQVLDLEFNELLFTGEVNWLDPESGGPAKKVEFEGKAIVWLLLRGVGEAEQSSVLFDTTVKLVTVKIGVTQVTVYTVLIDSYGAASVLFPGEHDGEIAGELDVKEDAVELNCNIDEQMTVSDFSADRETAEVFVVC